MTMKVTSLSDDDMMAGTEIGYNALDNLVEHVLATVGGGTQDSPTGTGN